MKLLSLTTSLEKPVHLHINAIIQVTNHMGAAQCIKWLTGQEIQLMLQHQLSEWGINVISVTLTVAWLFADLSVSADCGFPEISTLSLWSLYSK